MTEPDAVRPDIGGKARNLAELSAAGFMVPDSFHIDAATLAGWSPGTPPPGSVVSRVREAIDFLGGGPLAVRSSAMVEDGASASFAGIYETSLDVVGADGVLAAIEACLLSRNAIVAEDYSGGVLPPTAILIQPMVKPSTAGVAFTADPVTGDRDVVRVSGVRGAGASVASGEMTPDEWEVRDGEAKRRTDAGDRALQRKEVEAVAAVARRIEDHFSSPQDVEWAIVDGEVVVLQARPITSLPIPPALSLDGFNWEKDTAHNPEQITPFGGSVMPDPDRISAVFARYGLLIDGLEDRLIGGELYVRPAPVLGSPDSKSNPPPAWVLGLATRIVPALRRRMGSAKAALAEGIDIWARRWEEDLREEFLAEIEAQLSIDLMNLDDGALIDNLDSLRGLSNSGAEIHFLIAIPYFVALHRLDVLAEKHLSWTFARTVGLLASPASRADADLRPIREAIVSDPSLKLALEASASNPVSALRSVDPDLAGLLATWLRHHGWRSVNYDAGSRALIERPDLVTRLLIDAAVPNPSGQTADQEFIAAAAGLADDIRAELDEALDWARWIYPIREDNVILTGDIPSGLIRRWLLEAGRRLVARNLISRLDDAPYLESAEIVAALGGSEADLRATVARRRAEWAWVRAHPGPDFVGSRVPAPVVSRLPEAGRLTNGALLWAMGHEYPGSGPIATIAGDLGGASASPGVYRGPVRVVLGEADFANVVTGDVIVCPVTTPGWAVLFAFAGALVTDGGGVLSHAAIIAREHGIPAVLGTRHATTLLRDGEMVEVDGSQGIVRRLAKE